MVRNKHYIAIPCKRCDNEGIVSSCCTAQITFLSNGATKCTQCKKICKLDYCPDCKEEENLTYKVINDNTYQSTTEQKETKHKTRSQLITKLIVATIILLIIANIVIYVTYIIK